MRTALPTVRSRYMLQVAESIRRLLTRSVGIDEAAPDVPIAGGFGCGCVVEVGSCARVDELRSLMSPMLIVPVISTW